MAEGLSDGELLILERDELQKLKNDNPVLAIKLMEIFLKVLSKRLRGTTRMMYGIFG